MQSILKSDVFVVILTYKFPVECGRAVLQLHIYIFLPAEPLGIIIFFTIDLRISDVSANYS